MECGKEHPSAPASLPLPMLEPPRTHEASVQSLTVPPLGWTSWSEVPRDVKAIASAGPWFLEIFSGTANLTRAARAAGLRCLPPVDITPCELVPQPFDVVDAANWDFLMEILRTGTVRFLHRGALCNTFSAARKLDGGPPPLRSHEAPMGLSELKEDDRCLALFGNLFLYRSVEACTVVFTQGGDFSIENPEFSPPLLELVRGLRPVLLRSSFS